MIVNSLLSVDVLYVLNGQKTTTLDTAMTRVERRSSDAYTYDSARYLVRDSGKSSDLGKT